MYIYVSNSNDPFFNIALEEYLFLDSKYKNDILIIWINKPSIFIGKNQNPYQEINLSLLKDKNIPLLRRLSGGGTVYHDLGNINFSFIKKNVKLQEINFLDYTLFMQNLLKSFGLSPVITSRKDLFIDNKKISGSAQCIKSNNTLYHSTLLYNSNLNDLSCILSTNKNIKSNATLSKPSQVCNIGNLLNLDLDEFIKKCIDYLINNTIYNLFLTLDSDDINNINNICTEKYKSDSFIYGKTPTFKVDHTISINNKPHNLQLTIKSWKITSAVITDNFTSTYLDKLVGCKFNRDCLYELMSYHYPHLLNIINIIFN